MCDKSLNFNGRVDELKILQLMKPVNLEVVKKASLLFVNEIDWMSWYYRGSHCQFLQDRQSLLRVRLDNNKEHQRSTPDWKMSFFSPKNEKLGSIPSFFCSNKFFGGGLYLAFRIKVRFLQGKYFMRNF